MINIIYILKIYCDKNKNKNKTKQNKTKKKNNMMGNQYIYLIEI